MLKIKKKILLDFLDKVRMNNTQQIDEAIFRFKEDGLYIKAISQPMQVSINGFLKKEAFAEYIELGALPLGDLKTFKNILKRFSDEIELVIEKNFLIISEGKKSVDVPILNEDVISNEKSSPTLEYKDTFILTSGNIKSFIEDSEVNKTPKITIETKQGKVLLSNSGKYKFKNEFASDNCDGGVKVTFGSPLIDAISGLSGNLTFKVSNDYPCEITEEGEFTKITIIVAPFVESEE